MLEIAIKMLFGDRVKFLILISALAFATLLMTLQLGIFVQVMRWTSTLVRTTNVPVWVADPSVQQVNEPRAMIDTDLYRVRSVTGVKWAMPFLLATTQAKRYSGEYKSIILVGVDDTALFGIPPRLIEGKLEDLWKANSVIIDKRLAASLTVNPNNPVTLGDAIDINDHEVKIVGIVAGEMSLFGGSMVYTTYSRAVEILPPVRRTLSYILVVPQKGLDPAVVAKRISEKTGLRAFTQEQFTWSTIKWHFDNTAIPISILTAVGLGFIVGISVTCQTFYSFIHENIPNFSALKAMGLNNRLLKKMIYTQNLAAGFIGYAIGLGLDALFGILTLNSPSIPFSLTWQIPAITFALIFLICIISGYIGFKNVSQIDPAEAFRV